ncbi:MAG: hypothetical protein LBM69_01995 [Lachnospiraceae bacterium]|jgi:hypothetical protein|nr:hypothetical protein [Lachnospiraceae bacterium]
MIAILLKVLWWLGVIILTIIVTLLVLILLVLFVPIRYKVVGTIKPDIKKSEVGIRIRWLFVVYRLLLRPEGKKASILGIRLHPKRTRKPRRPHQNTSKDKQNPLDEQAGDVIQLSELVHDIEHEEVTTGNDMAPDNDMATGSDITNANNNERSNFRKYVKKAAWFKETLSQDDTKRVFRKLMRELKRLFKAICPRTLRGELTFGTGAPDTTGLAYGTCAIATQQFFPALRVYPDFDQAILKGSLRITGCIRTQAVVGSIFRIIIDKETRKVIRQLKREDT